MAGRIVLRPIAIRDLNEQMEYLAQRSPRVAHRFYEAAEKAFAFLAELPHSGIQCEFQDYPVSELRMFRIRQFEKIVVFFTPIENGIEVLRVLHSARDIQSIFEGQ